jgi:drug/metabolite transporter (DMT)-like permease
VVAPLALAVGAGLLLPFGVAFWDVPRSALGLVAASAALELAYFVLLARAYARTELAFVYPIARGAAPVLVLAFTLHFAPAVLLVVAGILLVRGPAGRGDLVLALAVGACIAGYTVVDDEAVERASAVSYLALVLAVSSVCWLGALSLQTTRRGIGPLAWARGVGVSSLRVCCAGVGMAVAYLLTLWALDRAAAGPVAAVRETSVLFAVVFAAVIARERVTPARAAGAALIVAGVGALALT